MKKKKETGRDKLSLSLSQICLIYKSRFSILDFAPFIRRWRDKVMYKQLYNVLEVSTCASKPIFPHF